LIVGSETPGEKFFNNRQKIGFKVVDILGPTNKEFKIKKKKSVN
jgi:peptidyl-tRNA hydrolase